MGYVVRRLVKILPAPGSVIAPSNSEVRGSDSTEMWVAVEQLSIHEPRNQSYAGFSRQDRFCLWPRFRHPSLEHDGGRHRAYGHRRSLDRREWQRERSLRET